MIGDRKSKGGTKAMNNVRIRLVSLVVLAALAAFAFTASSALAVPEWGQCYHKGATGGKYTNNVCTAKAAKNAAGEYLGEFEWRKPTEMEVAKRKVEGTAGEVVLGANYRLCEPSESVRAPKCHEGETEFTTKDTKLKCTAGDEKGDLSGTKNLVNVRMTLKGCTFEGPGPQESCSNTATPGEVVVGSLKGVLGFINKKPTPREVGLELNPTKSKAKWFSATCEGEIGFVVSAGQGNETEGCVYPQTHCGGDGVIAAIGPVNTATSTLTQLFSVNEAEAENVPSKFEGAKPLEVLEAYFSLPGSSFTTMWSKAGLSLTASTTTPEPIEIKAN